MIGGDVRFRSLKSTRLEMPRLPSWANCAYLAPLGGDSQVKSENYDQNYRGFRVVTASRTVGRGTMSQLSCHTDHTEGKYSSACS